MLAAAVGAVSARPSTAGASAHLPAGYGPTVTLTGHGFGHGIGLSQVGAYGYATHFGWSWDQILSHYYGGTTLGGVDSNQVLGVRLTANDDAPVTAVIHDGGLAATSANGFATGYSSVAAVATSPGHYRVYGLTAVNCPSATTTAEFEAPGSQWLVIAADVSSVDFTALGVDTTTAPVSSLLGLCEQPSTDQFDGGIRARYYRGSLRATTGTAGEYRTVNLVPLDRYVQGVVPREMPASPPAPTASRRTGTRTPRRVTRSRARCTAAPGSGSRSIRRTADRPRSCRTKPPSPSRPRPTLPAAS